MNIPWWKKEVIYQIYPRSFLDSNGDGIGDLVGIISKLDYLKDLGVGAIWLSPVYTSPNQDFGYDISNYYGINPEYGTLEDMQRLIKEAKNRNLKIIMDLVINHTSNQHSWFIESQNPESDKHDYYIWAKGRKKGGKELPPNNWQSHFTGPAWTKNEKTGLWYLHLFGPEQPDLNYQNPKVKEEIKKVMKYWLDLGVAGFRCDVINFIYKTSLKNGKCRIFYQGKELYMSQEGSHALLHEFYKELWEPYKAYTVGETVQLDLDNALRYTTEELSTVFQFDHLAVDQWLLPVFKKKYHPQKLKEILLKWQNILPWNTIFLENHDVPRSVSRFGNTKKYYYESTTALATLLLTLKGTAYIYQGQELGTLNYPFESIDEFQDVASINVYKLLRKLHFSHRRAFKIVNFFSRDHARRPFRWDSTESGGFTKGKPWLTITRGSQASNVENQTLKVYSVFNYYKGLLRLRNKEASLQTGTLTPVEYGKEVIAYYREDENQKFLIIINLGEKSYPLETSLSGEIVMSNYSVPLSSLKNIPPFFASIIKI